MSLYFHARILIVLYFCNLCTADSTPLVTLNHGGQLRGMRTSFQNTPVDVFLGVRYAEPPVGELRFKKPVSAASWEGIVDATDVGHMCPQYEPTEGGELMGDEDCLYLYITVPGGVSIGRNKPVMVWVHGGGYMLGSGIGYPGAALAVTGDVIMVTVNYRLWTLGFLSDGPGTGNFGLWDQRAALIWVKKNIEQFGGDPDLVTIFGMSAGGGSVAAQAMGQHNDGLFKRTIQQSGTLFTLWSWNLAKHANEDIVKAQLRRDHCQSSDTLTIYECLQNVPVKDLFATTAHIGMLDTIFKPSADGDFFSPDIKVHSYKPSHRFELLSGLNKQEGLFVFSFDILMSYAIEHNKSVEEGVDEQLARDYLLYRCTSQYTPLSPHLCVEYIMHLYGIDTAVDDKDRTMRLIEFLDDHYFDVAVISQLEERDEAAPTYAYHLTEWVPPGRLWPGLPWTKTGADHCDEMIFMFGIPLLMDEENFDFWKDIIAKDSVYPLFLEVKNESRELSTAMMKMWTNFAKSGNPNEPEKLPEGIPTWPQFNTETNQFLEINSKDMKVVTTPNKERIDRLRQVLWADRDVQHQAVMVKRGTPEKSAGQQRDEL